MKVSLDLTFAVPIWRFFYESDDKYKIPYEFIYEGKKYTNSICIIQFAWNIEKNNLINDNNFLNEKVLVKNARNVILCAPNIETLNLFKKYRPTLLSCLSNHNAFINENVYKIDRTVEQKIDLIVSSAFIKYKNYNLIQNIQNACAIGYFTSDTNNTTLPSSNIYCPNFDNKKRTEENYSRLDPLTICNFYNMSKIGGIFSVVEGACFSSSEYLLCGLPVLSCKSVGGREIWYNDNNSIICEPNEQSVIDNLKIMINKYNNGEYDREKIRNTHIEQMEIHRNNLTNIVIKFLQMITLDIPSFNELKDSLKYYHSNCWYGMDYVSINYEKQTIKEMQALKVLDILNI
jgi:hypothetical protein